MIKSSVEFNNTEYHNTTIQLKHATAAEFAAGNPILAKGEMGVETDTNKFKFGDGETAWNALAYAGGGAGCFKYGEYKLSANQTSNLAIGQKILFNAKVGGSLPAPNNGTITLPAGKTYRIKFMPYTVFTNATDSAVFQMYNATDAVAFGMMSVSVTSTYTQPQSQQQLLETFITTTKDTDIQVKIINNLNASLSYVDVNGTRLLIEEYGGI